jgi:hypothetical protein
MTALYASIRANLIGALEVMLGRPDGLKRVDASVEGFFRSFGAVLLLLPFGALSLISQQKVAAELDAEALGDGGFGLAMTALLVDWFAFPVVFALLARPFGLSARYVPFIVTRNWAAVVIAAMVGVVHAGHLLGVVPSSMLRFALLVAIAVALRFSYVIARTALAIPGWMALAVVAMDFLLSLTIWSAFERLVQA